MRQASRIHNKGELQQTEQTERELGLVCLEDSSSRHHLDVYRAVAASNSRSSRETWIASFLGLRVGRRCKPHRALERLAAIAARPMHARKSSRDSIETDADWLVRSGLDARASSSSS
jgi:hypothetical protein